MIILIFPFIRNSDGSISVYIEKATSISATNINISDYAIHMNR